MENNKTDLFSQGYACAVANHVRVYGHDTAAVEMYGANFLNEEQLREIGADEGDIEALLPVIKEIEERKNR